MRAILRRISKERKYNLVLADVAARLLRKDLHRPIEPEVLEELQTTNRDWRQVTALQRAEMRRRRGTRAQRIRSRFGSSPEIHQARLEHDKALRNLEGVLEQRESILYQIGDACAWTVLYGQTRLLVPLFNGGQQNTLPRGIGLAGPVHIATQAHATGNFLVVHNDLTRCLNTGDLTVVWSKRRWQHPAVFEVKTTEPDSSGQATISLLGIEGGWPADVELIRDFQKQLGFTVSEPGRLDERAERQWQEIKSQADLMQDISASGLRRLSADDQTLWKGIEVVLRAVLRVGYTYDLLERGVYMISVRNAEADDVKGHLEAARSRWKEDVADATPDLKWGSASTSQLATIAAGAPIAAPMLLWRIPLELAARLVANELILIGLVREDLWSELFAARGIEREIEEGYWLLTRGKGRVTFSPVEVTKITAGVIFSGISPAGVADAVAADLVRQEQQ